jgi:hypothetical protein
MIKLNQSQRPCGLLPSPCGSQLNVPQIDKNMFPSLSLVILFQPRGVDKNLTRRGEAACREIMKTVCGLLVLVSSGTLSSCYVTCGSHQVSAFAVPKLPSCQFPGASAVARQGGLKGWSRVRGKRLLLRAKDGSSSEKDDDIFGDDFPSYNYNAPDGKEDGAPKLPKFAKKTTQGAGGGFQVGFGGVGSRRTLPSLAPEDMTEELKERVFYVMLDAFDNYPPQAVGRMLDLLWEAGPDAGVLVYV